MGLRFEGIEVASTADQTVLDALIEAGVPVDHGCHSGACQRCLLRAEGAFRAQAAQRGLSASLRKSSHFLSCQAKCADVEEVFPPGDTAIGARPGKVVGQRYLSPTVVHLSVDVGPDFDFEGGQFVRFETAEGLKRSYSIATPTQDRRGILDFHIRLIPDGAMSEIVRTPDVIGREFQICGPMGSCVYELESSEPILMIASGTGLAPLYAILQDALHHEHPAPIWLYHGSATADGLYLCEELSAMASEFEQFTYVPCADTVDCPDDQTIRVGSPLILALVDHPDLTGVRVYSCGHPTLVRLAQKKCYIAGADLSRIHIDAFEPQNS